MMTYTYDGMISFFVLVLYFTISCPHFIFARENVHHRSRRERRLYLREIVVVVVVASAFPLFPSSSLSFSFGAKRLAAFPPLFWKKKRRHLFRVQRR